jgi:predicted RNA methylase
MSYETKIKRTSQRKRNSFDHYPSPLNVCRAALSLVPFDISVRPALRERIFDPGAGSGNWGTAAREIWGSASIVGCDIRDIPKPAAYDDWYAKTDFLKLNFLYADLVIGNPPYGIDAQGNKDKNTAEKFVRHSLDMLRDGGRACLLLRLAFLGGQKRGAGLFTELPPQSVHILSARPGFIPESEGDTDATEYMIAIWQKGWTGTPTLGWLNYKTWRPDGLKQARLI